jgi:hypothetical protein
VRTGKTEHLDIKNGERTTQSGVYTGPLKQIRVTHWDDGTTTLAFIAAQREDSKGNEQAIFELNRRDSEHFVQMLLKGRGVS